MAARRLIIIMLVLLVVSSAAAALVPEIERGREGSSTTSSSSTAETPGDDPADGRVLSRTVSAKAKNAASVRLRPGDRLVLRVTGDEVGLVSISSLGLSEDVAPLSPARFDLLFEEAGEHVVRMEGRRRPLARIVVAAEGPKRPARQNRDGGGEG